MAMNEVQMWADYNKLYGSCHLQSDNLMTLRSERKALLKEVFDFPFVDETVPLDFWKHGKDKHDGYELLLVRRGKEIFSASSTGAMLRRNTTFQPLETTAFSFWKRVTLW